MLTELTFAILKYGFLVLLWIFVACTVRSLYRDVETLSPRKSRAHRRKERRARKAVEAPAPVAVPAPVVSATSSAKPTLLVIIDGPLAGSSVPLSGNSSRPTMRASIRIPPPASGPSKTWVPPTALWSTSSV